MSADKRAPEPLLADQVSVTGGEIPAAEADSEHAVGKEAFPRERYLAYLNDELTAEELVEELMAHIEGRTG